MARIASSSRRCCEPAFPPGPGGDGGKGGNAGEGSKGANGGDVYLVGSSAFLQATRDFSIQIFGGENGSPGQPGIGGTVGKGGAARR
jgi:hypothetical protein